MRGVSQYLTTTRIYKGLVHSVKVHRRGGAPKMKPVPVLVEDAGGGGRGARYLMPCNLGPQPIILCEKQKQK